MIKRRILSLKAAVFFGIFFGISVPMLAAAFFTIYSTKAKLYEDFARYRSATTKNVALAMTDPIFYYSPNNGSLALGIIKQDERVTSVEVFDTMKNQPFIQFSIPDRNRGGIYSNREMIYKDQMQLGWVEVSFSDAMLTDEISQKKDLLVNVFGLTMLCMMLVMYPLLYLKMFSPMKRLLDQAQRLRENRFEDEFRWNGSDEMNSLGQSFELARISIMELINMLKNKNSELEKLYVTDRLTQLYNRHKLDEVLENERIRSRRFGRPFGVILMDVDNFKSVNDTYGHQAGDHVLTEIASILRDNTRKTDVAGRWGGEEFLVIVPETTPESIMELAEKLKDAIAGHHFGIAGRKTSSFGVAVYRQHEQIKDILSRVDEALYRAKNSGKNLVCAEAD